MAKRLLFLWLIALIVSCSGGAKKPGWDNKLVYTGLPPIAYLTEKIAGSEITVKTLLRAGQSPHTFKPTPSQISELSQTRLYLSIGFPFEETILAKFPAEQNGTKIVACDNNIKRYAFEYDYNHGDHQHQAHESDPHIWLSPANAKALAFNIYTALIEAYPSQFEEFSRNLSSLIDSLEMIDATIIELLQPYKGESIYVYHPAFGYFTDSYGLYQIAVEIEGKSPSPRQIEELIQKARKDYVKILFVQPQFDNKSAQVIANAIGGSVIAIDPLEKDLLQNFIHIATEIETSLNQFK